MYIYIYITIIVKTTTKYPILERIVKKKLKISHTAAGNVTGKTFMRMYFIIKHFLFYDAI